MKKNLNKKQQQQTHLINLIRDLYASLAAAARNKIDSKRRTKHIYIYPKPKRKNLDFARKYTQLLDFSSCFFFRCCCN